MNILEKKQKLLDLIKNIVITERQEKGLEKTIRSVFFILKWEGSGEVFKIHLQKHNPKLLKVMTSQLKIIIKQSKYLLEKVERQGILFSVKRVRKHVLSSNGIQKLSLLLRENYTSNIHT